MRRPAEACRCRDLDRWREPRGCWCTRRYEHAWCWCLECRATRAAAPRCPRGCGRPTTDPEEACPTCRHEAEERQREQRRRAAAKRQPPRPPHEGQPGRCALCGTSPLPPRRRSWCSDACVFTWTLATIPKAAKAHLLELHGCTCWSCGEATPAGELELEHRRPLWSLTDHERTELRWWLPFNLQLLCVPCHRAKSAREAAERAGR